MVLTVCFFLINFQAMKFCRLAIKELSLALPSKVSCAYMICNILTAQFVREQLTKLINPFDVCDHDHTTIMNNDIFLLVIS